MGGFRGITALERGSERGTQWGNEQGGERDRKRDCKRESEWRVMSGNDAASEPPPPPPPPPPPHCVILWLVEYVEYAESVRNCTQDLLDYLDQPRVQDDNDINKEENDDYGNNSNKKQQ